MNNKRGMECELPDGGIRQVMNYLAEEDGAFYIQRCTAIDQAHPLMPGTSFHFSVSAEELRRLAQNGIWELVLDVYPRGAKADSIVSYSDFQKSACLCRVFYYDCRFLDLYVKNPGLFAGLKRLLLSLGAENLYDITDASDQRTELGL